MQRPGVFRHLIAKCFVAATISACLCTGAVWAQAKSANYAFLVGSGFLCDPNSASACAATAKADPGDSYEMSGAGTFDAQSKSVKAAGTYTHKSPNGNVLETGVWLANELVSFDSYGVAPNELPRLGITFAHAEMPPKRIPMSRGPMPTGGLAVFRILLVPISGLSTTAVLQVNSALGDVPRERSLEGIRLTLEKSTTEFSEEVGGRVMFLAIRPEAGAPAKAPQHEPGPDSAADSVPEELAAMPTSVRGKPDKNRRGPGQIST